VGVTVDEAGETINPSASMVRSASPIRTRPTSTIAQSRTADVAAVARAPEPSTMVPLR
jgi:hypothetical protein